MVHKKIIKIRGFDPCNPWLITVARMEAVAYPGLGENVAGTRGVGLNLLTQVADKHTQVFILFDVITSPQRREQRSVRQHFSGMLDEVDQQIEFFRSEVNRFAAHRNLTRLEVNVKISRIERRLRRFIRRRRLGAAQ